MKIGTVEAGLARRGGRARSRATRSTRVDGERFEFFGERTVVDALRGQRRQDDRRSTSRRADGTAARRSARRCGRAAELSATRGALGVSKLTQAYSGAYVGHDIGEAAVIASGPGHALGRADPRRARPARRRHHQGPDRAAAGLRPDRHRRLARGHLPGARPDPDPVRRRHPVGQPRRREHPAVPAARRRADGDAGDQAPLRDAGQPPRRAADLRRRLRVPAGVHPVDLRASTSPGSATRRHDASPAGRRPRSTSAGCGSGARIRSSSSR